MFLDNEMPSPELPANMQMNAGNDSFTDAAAATPTKMPVHRMPNIDFDMDNNGVMA